MTADTHIPVENDKQDCNSLEMVCLRPGDVFTRDGRRWVVISGYTHPLTMEDPRMSLSERVIAIVRAILGRRNQHHCRVCGYRGSE